MQRIQVYLDNTLQMLLSEYAEYNRCSISRAASRIIFAYLTDHETLNRLQKENKHHFLRLINVLNQVFFCVYDAKKTRIPSVSAEDCLAQIKKSVTENMAIKNPLALD